VAVVPVVELVPEPVRPRQEPNRSRDRTAAVRIFFTMDSKGLRRRGDARTVPYGPGSGVVDETAASGSTVGRLLHFLKIRRRTP
jgi:hypothetical protein